MHDIDGIHLASKLEKIGILEAVSHASEAGVIRKTVALLDDPDIEVRGEAFGALVLNRNDISGVLVESLNSGEKNVRAFTALVLGNRGDNVSVGALRRLTADQSPTVRSCALGALGYLGAKEAEGEIRDRLGDPDTEVKASALRAAIDIGCTVSEKEMEGLAGENNDELDRLVSAANRNRGG